MHPFKLMTFFLLFSVSLSYGQKCSSIPKDRAKLPASLEKEMKAIASLCELDTLEKKVRKLERILKNLERCLPYHLSEGGYPYNVNHGLRAMQFIYDGEEMQIYWEHLFNDKTLKEGDRAPVLREYVYNRAIAYGIRSQDAKDPRKAYTTFKYDWEHDVYRGFYCVNYVKPPPPYERTNFGN